MRYNSIIFDCGDYTFPSTMVRSGFQTFLFTNLQLMNMSLVLEVRFGEEEKKKSLTSREREQCPQT